MSDSDKLSPEEQQAFSECLAIIQKGPPTAEAIGEAIHRVEKGRLYRGVVNDMKTFFDIYAKLEPEDGLRMLEEWRRSPSGMFRNGPLGIILFMATSSPMLRKSWS
jgi:hypothetical protein